MLTIRPRTVILIGCLLEAAWLLVAQTLGYTAFLIPCLVAFLALTAWSAIKGMALPVLLFFLPFATLLKIRPGEISFFTIALVAVYAICLLLGHKKISVIHAIPGAAVVALCLIVKTVYNYQPDKSFLLFSASLMLAPFVAKEFGKKYDFYWLTLFFSIGIVIASISSLYLTGFPTIARYIEYYELFGVVRHSGYYGDPNFYSAHISAALSGILVLFLNNTSKRRFVLLVIATLLLMYCGFLAVSKTFFLIAICLLLLFFLEFMFQKGKVSAKLLLLITIIIGVAFLLSTTAFSKLVDMILSRFASDTNLSDFTTGRTDLWIRFFHAFMDDGVLLAFGKGYTDVTLIERGAHNTIIQAVYQFGLVGCLAMVGWMVCCFRVYLSNVNVKWNCVAQIFLILIGTVGPWMALDLLFFDEFFLMPMYICVGVISVANKSADRAPEIKKGKYVRYGKQSGDPK